MQPSRLGLEHGVDMVRPQANEVVLRSITAVDGTRRVRQD
jgi:hypothetical protein